MNPKDFGYSLKDIPIPQKTPYTKALVEKTESFLKRLRWKAHFFLQNTDDMDTIEKTNPIDSMFKSDTTPPQVAELIPFENDMYDLIRNIKYQNQVNEFQTKLQKDVEDIKASNELLIPADKTTNLYNVTVEQYNKLLDDNITKTYRKSEVDAKRKIDIETKAAAISLQIENKMECYAEQPAFLTFKDHKDNFATKLPCRLINPAKNEIGVVSKHLIEVLNRSILDTHKLNQWRNSSSVIEWFKNITNKGKCRFVKFDIAEFYPSISEELLKNSINFARTVTDVPYSTVNIINLARKSLLFDNEKTTWVKKGENPTFDVTMGCYDGAEVCELVGLYMLNKLRNIITNENIGLYRDDGLAVVENANGPKMDKIRKSIIKIFQEENLSITIETNLLATDFLDVSFDLRSGKYFPYRKPNSKPLYVNAQSNHPPVILRQLPKMINQRLTNLSCDQHEFEKCKDTYQTSLKDSGYRITLKYEPNTTPQNRNRTRKIIWYNPPFNMDVRTNIGNRFLNLVKKHFKKPNPLRKIFNTNTIKLSYSCTPNIKKIITKHNNHLLNKKPNQELNRTCNCRSKPDCPLDGKCLTSCIVYKAVIQTQNETLTYFGASEGEFKTRYNNHKKSFKNVRYKTETELSKKIWALKDNSMEYNLSWSIEARAFPYSCGARRCDLCITEKACIIRANANGLLNKRTELLSKCRHRNKYLIGKSK